MLRAERAERLAAADRAATKARAQTVAADAKARAKREQAAIVPSAIFTPDVYGPQRDEQGLPTHDAQGVELTKSARKRVAKEYQKQQELHQRYLDGKL